MMSPVVFFEAWGFTLLHFCWQAAALAALYKAADLLRPRMRSQTRYVLALGTLLATAAAAVATFIYEVVRLTPDAGVAVANPVLLPALGGDQAISLQTVLPWVEAAWLLGVVALSCRTLAGLYMIHRLKKHAQPVPESLANRFAWAVRRLGLTGKVRLRLHPHISGPFVIGAFRSIVYLPASALMALTPDQLDAVLAHELEHIRRADYAWNLVQNVIETVFFFHPAVWWLGGVLREQRELCCDDAALKACDDPLTYATALLSLEEQRRGAPRLAMALNGQGEGKSLMGRIARMLGEKAPMARGKTRPHAALALPVILLVLAAFITPVAQVAASSKTPEPLAVEDETCDAKDHDHAEGDATHVVAALDAAYGEHPWAINEDGEWLEGNLEDIDPDAIAAEVRADLLAAKADIESARHIDAEAIAEEVRADMERAKADMERQGIHNHGIDPDAIAAQVRADLANHKADIAVAEAIDVEAIAEQARADAQRAKDDMRRHRRMTPPPAPEAFHEVPAPLASSDDMVPPPPAAPVAMPSVPAPPAPPVKLKTVKVAMAETPVKAKAVSRVVVVADVATASAPVILLKGVPAPAPSVRTAVTVRVAPTVGVKVGS
ncbi:blaR1 peptidase M56 family protein [Asticcacaulis biprosthecium C19]|uniref:BlaR1 peptidase M56 family protein n=1 Tax=Asticcacaulis biprosthecium C19 TaxID=715226 RepID=F4QQR0_9CAUL|nr:M56 family metallopeptidase [Asticcacaulis biprosthecium]EGF90547.1 blaR1 peptidase M56 family protein [Asticcacaulis biprosthecium C19]